MRATPKESPGKDHPRTARDRARTLGTVSVCLCVVGYVFYLYLRTLAPTVLYYDRPDLLDAVMLQTQVITLSMTHPTGYPTYTLLAHLFTYLPFGDPAYRVNLASAVFGTLAVALAFAVGLRLARSAWAAALGALAFGPSGAFWGQAVVAGNRTLNIVFVCSVLLVLLLWRDKKRDRYLLWACFLMGLSLTHHMTSGLLLPASFLFVGMVDWRKLTDRRLALKGAGLFLAGLLPYLYLPVRAAMKPPMNEADPTSFGRFWEFVSGGDLTRLFGAIGPGELPLRLALYGGYVRSEFGVVLVLMAMIGIVVAFFRDRAVMVLFGFLYVGWLLYALEYKVVNFQDYFIPAYLILTLFACMGLGAVLDGAGWLMGYRSPVPLRAAVALLFSFPVLFLTFHNAQKHYASVDRSHDYKGRRIIEEVARRVPPHATILHHRSSLWYMVLVEKRRRDLTLVDPWDPYFHRYTSKVWPDKIDEATSNIRWGTEDYTGVAAAEVAAKKGPVYILDEPTAEPQNFEQAGFSFVPVEQGIVYELVPPGGRPYTSAKKQMD